MPDREQRVTPLERFFDLVFLHYREESAGVRAARP